MTQREINNHRYASKKISKLLFTTLVIFSTSVFSQNYTYDNLSRLTRVTYAGGKSITYVYDAAGNILRKETIASAIPPPLAINFTATDISTLGGSSAGSFSYLDAASSGRNRPAAKFDSGFIKIPHSAAMQFNAGGTFDLWARIDSKIGMDGWGSMSSASWVMSILAKSHDRYGAGFLLVHPDWSQSPAGGYGYGWIAHFDTSWTCEGPPLIRNPSPALGEWFRLTIVMDAAEGYRWYVNKQLALDCRGTMNFTQMNSRDLHIGRFDDNLWYPLIGAVSDLRIYQKALSIEDVQMLP